MNIFYKYWILGGPLFFLAAILIYGNPGPKKTQETINMMGHELPVRTHANGTRSVSIKDIVLFSKVRRTNADGSTEIVCVKNDLNTTLQQKSGIKKSTSK